MSAPVPPTTFALTVAEQDAQAETATRTQRKHNQARGTKVNWDPKKEEFIRWAKQRYASERYPEIVTGIKLHSFLTLEQVDRPSKRPRKTGANAEEQSVGYSTIGAYTSAIIDLWQEQVVQGVNNHPHPRTATVKSLLHNVQSSTAKRNRAAFKDKRGAADDGYDGAFYRKLCRHFLVDGGPIAMRSLLAQIIGHQCLLRGDSIRHICLSDLELGEMPNGLSPARILIIKLFESKSNRTGRVEYSGALRHKEFLIDPHFVLALYLFMRFHILQERFPDLTSNSTWYRTRLLRGNDQCVEAISYDAHKNPIAKAFKSLGLVGCKKVTHAARGSGAREAVLLEVGSNDIERLGAWKATDAMSQSYLTHLPIRALRAMSGFSPSGGSYYLVRDTLEPPHDLQLQIFPQIEAWQQRLDDGSISASGGADKLLVLLRYLRRVILQDGPSLSLLNLLHPVLQHSIFQSKAYRSWLQQQQIYLQQHQAPLDLSLQSIVPTLHDKLQAILQTQAVIQTQLTQAHNDREATNQLAHHRDEAIIYEIRRHSSAILRLYTAPAAAFDQPLNQDPPAAQSLPPSLTHLTASTSTPLLTSDDGNGPATAAGSAALLSSGRVVFANFQDEEAETFEMARTVKTVAQAWEEYEEGWEGGPALKDLETRFGTRWCGGPSTAKRRAFLRRMVIIKAIKNRNADLAATTMVERLQQRMGQHSLDWLRKQLEETSS